MSASMKVHVHLVGLGTTLNGCNKCNWTFDLLFSLGLVYYCVSVCMRLAEELEKRMKSSNTSLCVHYCSFFSIHM